MHIIQTKSFSLSNSKFDVLSFLQGMSKKQPFNSILFSPLCLCFILSYTVCAKTASYSYV